MSAYLKAQIKCLIVAALELDVNPAEIPDDETLFGGGMDLDSMATLEVVATIEEAFDITVEDDELTSELFDSVETLAEYVAGKQRV
ncbi:MAG: phosphopantetheine-binding protein [Gemmatimonadetes bacterium]|nr:phosphopantetheine-binding protein [Gemmatimonadota bacterium]